MFFRLETLFCIALHVGAYQRKTGARRGVKHAPKQSSGYRSFSGQAINIYWIQVSVVNSSKKFNTVRQDVEQLEEMHQNCEPVEPARSLGVDTHAVVTRPQCAREHGLHTQCGHWRRWFASLAYR